MSRRPLQSSSPFHSGELEAQRRMGVADKIAPFATAAIRPFLPDQHRDFFSELHFLVLCARTAEGNPALSTLTGAPGFCHSPSPSTLQLDALPPPDDPLAEQLRLGSNVGILGLLPHQRRRNRANGVITRADSSSVEVQVVQSFGNCKQHIRARELVPVRRTVAQPRVSEHLDDERARHLIERADTFFIGTGSEGEGLDASHRGGPPGFVRVLSSRALAFPDYAGNNFYNTVGNLLRDPRVALLFIDFERGDLLHVFGRANITWLDPEPSRSHPRVERLVQIDVERVALRPSAWGLSTSSRTDSGESNRSR